MSRRELSTLILTLFLALFAWWRYEPHSQPTPSGNGFGGSFTLQSVNGNVSLNDFHGKAVILMFGYTSCPDVCPSGLASIAAALDQLDETARKEVQPLFISVDPQRDTPERLANYSGYFHPQIIGLGGDDKAIAQVANSFGVFYRKVELKASALGYAMDHTARYYLLDRDGSLRGVLDHGVPPGLIARALSDLLNGID